MRKTETKWLQLEKRIRDVLRTAAKHTDARDLGLLLQEISDIVGEETGRGYELPENWWKILESDLRNQELADAAYLDWSQEDKQ